MINFNAGARRPAQDDLRVGRTDAATELVLRTLRQHGLIGQAGPSSAASSDVMTSVQTALAEAGLARGVIPVRPHDIPAGAEFRKETFTGKSGSRSYRTYVPASLDGQATGIVMMLHGCTQTPEDFAAGTAMNTLAERHRLIVIYPHQSRGTNAQSCWNWFSPGDQKRGRGEPEILAGIAKKAMADFRVGPDRTFVSGLSAGAAMALILGDAYPDIFAAVGAHSGLPLGAAQDVPSAFAAMAGNASLDAVYRRTANISRCIVFHGSADSVVQSSNGDVIMRQAESSATRPTVQTRENGTTNGRGYLRTTTSDPDCRVLVEHWLIDGLGHAWSGGRADGSYTDPQGPDASAEMIRFFVDHSHKDA